MLRYDAYLMARHEAAHHVVVEVHSTALVDRTPGPLKVDGKVVGVYRAGDSLRLGDRVSFCESVMCAGEEIPCGGTWWKERGHVEHARYIEAFLNGDPPDCEVALWQSVIVPDPSGGPRMKGWHPLVTLRERKRRQLAEKEQWKSWWWWILG